MNEQLKALAEQAGIFKEFAVSGLWLADDQELERFAELVRQDEREHIKQENQRCYVESEKYRNQK